MKSLIFLLLLYQLPCIASGSQTNIQSASKKQAILNPSLKESYLKLLTQAKDFHKVLARGDKQAIQQEIKETQEIIAKLYRQLPSVTQIHHRIHSYRLLKSIEDQLSVMNSNSSSNQEQEQKNIKTLFNSFLELAQVYNLKKDIKDKVFYCSKDKSVWFQETAKVNNPVNSAYKDCGRLIL